MNSEVRSQETEAAIILTKINTWNSDDNNLLLNVNILYEHLLKNGLYVSPHSLGPITCRGTQDPKQWVLGSVAYAVLGIHCVYFQVQMSPCRVDKSSKHRYFAATTKVTEPAEIELCTSVECVTTALPGRPLWKIKDILYSSWQITITYKLIIRAGSNNNSNLHILKVDYCERGIQTFSVVTAV